MFQYCVLVLCCLMSPGLNVFSSTCDCLFTPPIFSCWTLAHPERPCLKGCWHLLVKLVSSLVPVHPLWLFLPQLFLSQRPYPDPTPGSAAHTGSALPTCFITEHLKNFLAWNKVHRQHRLTNQLITTRSNQYSNTPFYKFRNYFIKMDPHVRCIIMLLSVFFCHCTERLNIARESKTWPFCCSFVLENNGFILLLKSSVFLLLSLRQHLRNARLYFLIKTSIFLAWDP